MWLAAPLLVGCGTERAVFTPLEASVPAPPAPPEVFPPSDPGRPCVSGTIDGGGGVLDASPVVLRVPRGAFGPEVAGSATVCLAGEGGLTESWQVSFDRPLVVPVLVELAVDGPPEQAAVFVPDAGGVPVRSLAPQIGFDRISAPLYRSGVVFAAIDDRVQRAYNLGELSDVLLVVDNSVSMGGEQETLAAAVPLLISLLADIDAHLGVVSTDLDDPSQAGKLRQVDGVRWIDPTTADPVGVFEEMVRTGTTGSNAEQGIGAAYAALERNGDGYNAGFVRPTSRLVIGVVSDEADATSSAVVTRPQFVDWLLAETTHSGVSFHSLVMPGLGRTYAAITTEVGGTVTDITDKTFAPFATALAESAAADTDLLDPPSLDVPEAWWAPADGSEPQRLDPARVGWDGERVEVDAADIPPEDVVWLLYEPTLPDAP